MIDGTYIPAYDGGLNAPSIPAMFLMLFDCATFQPVRGYVTSADCVAIPAGFEPVRLASADPVPIDPLNLFSPVHTLVGTHTDASGNDIYYLRFGIHDNNEANWFTMYYYVGDPVGTGQLADVLGNYNLSLIHI